MRAEPYSYIQLDVAPVANAREQFYIIKIGQNYEQKPLVKILSPHCHDGKHRYVVGERDGKVYPYTNTNVSNADCVGKKLSS